MALIGEINHQECSGIGEWRGGGGGGNFNLNQLSRPLDGLNNLAGRKRPHCKGWAQAMKEHPDENLDIECIDKYLPVKKR